MKIYTCKVAIRLESTSEKDACEKVKKYCDIVNSYSGNESNINMKFIFLPEEGVDIETVKDSKLNNYSLNKWMN